MRRVRRTNGRRIIEGTSSPLKRPSYSAKAEYPVFQGFSLPSLTLWNTGSPAFAGDDASIATNRLAHTLAPCPASLRSRNSRFSTLPIALRGSVSTITTSARRWVLPTRLLVQVAVHQREKVVGIEAPESPVRTKRFPVSSCQNVSAVFAGWLR
jgi:hypothetical protein